jgi:transcriptional regulator with XRE-family HTH domain
MGWDKDSVKALRKQLGLTQMDFARYLGCRQQTVSEWELGIYAPANAYGKLLDQLGLQFEQSVPVQKRPDPVEKKIKEHVRGALASARDSFGLDEVAPPFDPAVD